MSIPPLTAPVLAAIDHYATNKKRVIEVDQQLSREARQWFEQLNETILQANVLTGVRDIREGCKNKPLKLFMELMTELHRETDSPNNVAMIPAQGRLEYEYQNLDDLLARAKESNEQENLIGLVLGKLLEDNPFRFCSYANLKIPAAKPSVRWEFLKRSGALQFFRQLDWKRSSFFRLPEAMGDLTNLTRLDLNYCQLAVLPRAMSNLMELQTLSVDHNRLIEFPINLPPNLFFLSLVGNQISRLPDCFPLLPKLTYLYLKNNSIQYIPDSISSLSKLVNLNLSFNKISFISSEIGKLRDLKDFWIDNNKISELPRSIGQLTKMTVLLLGNNELSDLPPTIMVKVLDLSYNHFAHVPKVLVEKKAKVLSFAGNYFSSKLMEKITEEKKLIFKPETQKKPQKIL